VEPLARAYRRALRKSGGALLGYANPEGHPRLRLAIAAMLSAARGLAVSAEHIFVTRGSQMALALTARALLRPGDCVAVEALGYCHAWQTFTTAGANIIRVPVDELGLDVRALARLLETQRISAVYTTPHHQFPTTVTMAPARRLQLLELARLHRFAIIEDDYDHEFHYDGRPVLPLASLDRAGVVIYVGTFSKVLAPGVRLGFVAGSPALLAHLGAYREFIDMQGDAVTEAAVAEMLEEGEVQRHVRRVRRVYGTRRDLLVTLLRQAFGDDVEFTIPGGGVALWIHARGAVDVDAWARAAIDRGVAFQTARSFSSDGRRRPFARLGFACLDGNELREAVGRLRLALDDLSTRRSA
jgi:GntR family transcriptional regulator / MocR family aminotransferase